MTSIVPIVPVRRWRPHWRFRRHRSFGRPRHKILREQVKDLFALVTDELARLAGETAPFYSKAPDGAPPFVLRVLVSPLAEGARPSSSPRKRGNFCRAAPCAAALSAAGI